MDNSFEILTRFLERFGDEVEGRSLEDIPEEVRAKLRAFASGGLPVNERRELAQLLKDHPGWVSVLAAEVKAGQADGA